MTQVAQNISPLRQRMIDDMTMRKLNSKTQIAYIRAVKNFAAYFGHSPHLATADDLRRYQLHLAETGTSSFTINATITGLRFLFQFTLERPEVVAKLATVSTPRKLPTVLSPEEVSRLIMAAANDKYKAALAVAYGAGLRVSEVVHLKVSDVDSLRMILHVEQGKGSKDRNAMLSPTLLAILRHWWRVARAHHWVREGGWLFPGLDPVDPVCENCGGKFHVHRKYDGGEIVANISSAQSSNNAKEQVATGCPYCSNSEISVFLGRPHGSSATAYCGGCDERFHVHRKRDGSYYSNKW